MRLCDGEVTEGVGVGVLVGIVFAAEVFHLLVCFAKVFGERHVLFDQILDAAGFVELQQGGHLVALLGERVMFAAKLGKRQTAFLELL